MSTRQRDNIGFIGMRNYAYDVPTYNYAFVSNKIINTRIFISQTGTAKLFPLFIYKEKGNNDSKLFNKGSKASKSINIKDSILKKLNAEFRNSLKAKEILGYIYAVLYAKTFRIRYSDYLETDYPRIPFTKNEEIFKSLMNLGIDLIDSHLLEEELISPPSARFQGKGNNKIAKTKRVGRNYKPEEERVYINKDEQYFEGIPPEVWEYQIGGYQVLDKWLKDKGERQLSLDEIKKYCKIVTAIKNTIDLQQKIDEVYPAVEEETIDFSLGENK